MRVEIPDHFTQEQFENKINEIGIENITELWFHNCPNILEIPYLPNLKLLQCSRTNITSIPYIEKLELLHCCMCPNLTEIPYFPNLRELQCFYTNIKSISPMEKIKLLVCSPCPNLHKISYCFSLNILYCDDYLKIKFYKKDLEINNEQGTINQQLQGRLFQNTYRTYELLIF